MSTPTLTLRSLKNEDTGIDISVLNFKKEDAPLGGVSILYEVFVVTRLDLFKTRLHKTGDIVHFTIFKAYREVEDLYIKLNKKYPKASLPPVPKSSTADKYTLDERVEALNIFMSALAKNTEICYSSTFTQFIGINSQRHPSFTIPNAKVSSLTSETINDDKQEHSEKSEDDEIPELFPKMKNVANGKVQTPKNVDLFEEAKRTSSSSVNDTKSFTSKGLFDDFEDENLFAATVVQKTSPPKEPVTKKVEKAPAKPQPVRNSEESIVDDSQIIIKDRKLGDLSLFKEQDLGDYIMKEEENLFMVTPSGEKNKKNTLLSPREDDTGSQKNINENLDDLLFLDPLPDQKKPEEKQPEVSSSLEKVPPVPRPRKISVEKLDTEPLPQKPEVAPRKVFLNKPNAPPKPALPTKPTQLRSAKPAPPTKPKPPSKKPTTPSAEVTNDTLDSANANQSDATDNSNIVTGLKDLDILKYIEQEEKSIDSNLSLFD